MDTMQHIVQQLRNLGLPADVTDRGEFIMEGGIILRTAVPGKGLLETYRQIYPAGLDILVDELASAVHNEVDEIRRSGNAGRPMFSDLLKQLNLK